MSVLSKRILVVDDSATMRRILCNVLAQIGFTSVTSATGGGQAIALLNSEEYGLVISDWKMEPITGLDLVRAIRGTEKIASMPVLMVSAESEKNRIITAIACGISDYIVKPFTRRVLEQKLENIFGPLS
ncbi:chemotaxis regulator transmitting signal to flagellar motor component cheY [Magnetospirillum sp. XM-1]|uniref:response regulator n=1 Tax=Magnetospirillum sp. XM-1 TaxID=1663591 RepID=UPI00073DBC49|nr:response regulator [Magnetospirillum sp. XM-1]CUW40016.1 chemotaxis regulator transmitting signal to flagellar motor component cheY [Magnetospirillum sp. XM-1]